MTEAQAAPDWPARAAAAERSVRRRHLRRLAGLPGTALGVPRAAGRRLRPHAAWHWQFWWQAQLLDCLVDAFERAGGRDRATRIRALVRAIGIRNGGRFTNQYFDDMAWLGLAMQRAGGPAGATGRRAVSAVLAEIIGELANPRPAGLPVLPWRRGDRFYNAPANGPAAILLARTGHPAQAIELTDWMHSRLLLPSGLIADGFRAEGSSGRLEDTVYTYCQGVVLGAELALSVAGHRTERAGIHRLTDAVHRNLATGGVLIGHGTGDGGLFTGILARYLAQVAVHLPGVGQADDECRRTATRLVLDTADACWAAARHSDTGPQFDDANPALSVQLGGWMTVEAAALLTSQRSATPAGRRILG